MINLKDVEGLLGEADLNINISKNGDACVVSILPKMKKDSEIKFAPIVISGTIAELQDEDAVGKAINEGLLQNRDKFVNVNYFTATLAANEAKLKEKVTANKKTPAPQSGNKGADLFAEKKEEEEGSSDD